MKHGKKYNESAKLIEKTKLYDTDEAFGCSKHRDGSRESQNARLYS